MYWVNTMVYMKTELYRTNTKSQGLVPAYFALIINPRRACAARVTVVVLCVCMCVCMCVCVCVCPLIPAASHIGITKERYQRILRNTGIVLNFADFPKNASFKSYGVICLPRAAPAS